MKAVAYLAVALSSLLVIVWPVFLFLGIFAFDKPLHGVADVGRTILVCCVLSYPLGYFIAIAFILVRKARRKSMKWWETPTAFLFLIPYAHLLVSIALLVLIAG